MSNLTVPKIESKNLRMSFPLRPEKGKRNHEEQTNVFTAIQDVNLTVKDGEFMVLVGPSGCGKTTFLHLIGGLEKASAGSLYINGKLVKGPGLDRGIVFQQYALLPWKTALGNIEFGLEVKKAPKKERPLIARQYLNLVGLTGFGDRFPHELSGGMRQRVAIARSLAYDPDILLMDEPFAALDAQTRETLQDELLRIWETTGKTVVFITHSIDEAVYLGQRVAVMTSKPGRIKQIVDVTLPGSRQKIDDLRSHPEFVRIRHIIWELLRDEVKKTQNDSMTQFIGKESKEKPFAESLKKVV
jgi:NitT/TauT family transport system ATP-binding protein